MPKNTSIQDGSKIQLEKFNNTYIQFFSSLKNSFEEEKWMGDHIDSVTNIIKDEPATRVIYETFSVQVEDIASDIMNCEHNVFDIELFTLCNMKTLYDQMSEKEQTTFWTNLHVLIRFTTVTSAYEDHADIITKIAGNFITEKPQSPRSTTKRLMQTILSDDNMSSDIIADMSDPAKMKRVMQQVSVILGKGGSKTADLFSQMETMMNFDALVPADDCKKS
jgi:hypothetical protein